MRKYKENRKSVKAKTYKDYLEARQQYIDKGFNVRSALSKEAFDQVYNICAICDFLSFLEYLHGCERAFVTAQIYYIVEGDFLNGT